MENDLIKHTSWCKKYWKWLISISIVLIILFVVFLNSNFGGALGSFAKAYNDMSLYENALEEVKKNDHIISVLGNIKPIDNASILNGDVNYSNNDKAVNSTIKIIGEKGDAMMDISASKNTNSSWNYNEITIRIKQPIEKKETITVLKSNSQ